MADLQDGGNDLGFETPKPFLVVSASFKGDNRSKKKNQHLRSGSETEDFINLLHGSDPVKVELNRLENEVRGAVSGYLLRLCHCIFSLLLLFFRGI